MKYIQYHDKPALILKQQAISYAQLFEHIHAYAAFFQNTPHTKAAIYSENRFEWVYALYAAWTNRSIAVPIDFMATADEVAYMLNDCTPEIIFCSREKERELRDALTSVSYVPNVIIFEDIADIAPQGQVENGAALERDNNDTALIIYTSGTTGSPKGAMLSFDNLLANADGVSKDAAIYSAEQRVLVFLPLHHIYPLLGSIIIPMYVGATCIFSPSMAADDIRETLQQHGVTLITGVPRFYTLLRKGIRDKIQKSAIARTLFRVAEYVDSPAFSRRVFHAVHEKFGGKIRFLISGGAALDNDVARDFKTLGFDVLIGYGMTEAAPMIAFTRPGTLRIGASGHPLPCNEVKIVDGEILAKGRNVMQGYYNRPEETAAVIKDGWLHTGDLGQIDDDGYVVVTGRKKDTIVLSNGKNINPEELENKILKEFPAVREIGVFANQGALQAIIFPNFQQLQDGGVHAIDEFMRWNVLDEYNRNASPAKKIMSFTLVKTELPKTRLGKIKRFQLAELIENASKERPHEPMPDYPEYRMIAAFIKEQTGKSAHPEDHLEIDLGLDSLDKVSLMTFLHSTFGVDLQDNELLQHVTVGKIAEYAREKKVKMTEEGVNWHQLLHENANVELPTSSLLHVVVSNMFKFLLRRYFQLRVTGLEHLPGSPVIFASNHQSFLDGLVIGSFFNTEILKRTYYYAAEQHFRKRWLQWFAARNNIIVVDMNRQLKLSLQKMATVLQRGNNIVIFPEGSRTRDGRLADFKKTFAILSRELNIPVVPIVLEGAYDAMPIGKGLPKFRQPITVSFLPPIQPEDLSYEALTENVRQTIQGRLKE